jgi:predicted flap endonuclease-1-like 5' DNA nuclease
MFALIVANWFLFLLAVLIGIATGWWVWARYAANVATSRMEAPAPKLVVPPVVTPPVAAPLMAAPEPVKAKPASAKAKVTTPKAKVAAPKVTTPKAKPDSVKSTPVKAAPVKVAVVPAPKATPKPKTAVKPAAKPKAAPKPKIPDNLELLKGVGPKLNALLKSLGIMTFEQVANWKATDIADIDAKLGNFAGRIGRDNWVDQAKLLVKGDIAGFEKKYGSLGSEINRG